MPVNSLSHSLITTSSGIVGGLSKAIGSGFVFCSITLTQLTDVAIYAAVSATTGYLVKLGIDKIRKPRKRRNG